MSEGVLTGLHGKLPATGDFVDRGLPPGLRGFWDLWVSRHLARRTGWPAGGLRLKLVSGGRAACAVAVPSCDAVGRRYPLTGFLLAAGLPSPAQLDPWCDAAALALEAAARGTDDADALDRALDALAPPVPAAPEPGPALTLWTRGHPPETADPDDPGAVLDRLFGVSCSAPWIP